MCGGTGGCVEVLEDVWMADNYEEELSLCGKLEVGPKAV